MHKQEEEVAFPLVDEESERLMRNSEGGLSQDSIRPRSHSIQRKRWQLFPWVIHVAFEFVLILLLWKHWKSGSNVNCVSKHAAWCECNMSDQLNLAAKSYSTGEFSYQ
jgi:hypothetical protein